MVRQGWNPARRNRNIGTAKAGRGRDNSMVIPSRWSDDRVFWEKLHNPVTIEKSVGGRAIVVLVEPVVSGFTHCCTPDDVLGIVEHLGAEELGDLRLFVLRQPKRKEAVLSPVWGRLAYFAELGARSGPAVYLEAQQLGRVWRSRRSMSVDARRELERLIADGHYAETVPSGVRIRSGLEACRNTQLFRTLLHEIGHQVDYLNSVERPHGASVGTDQGWEERLDRYWQKSTAEKEAFAHRYAEEKARQLRALGAIPFERAADPRTLRNQGLDEAWFEPAAHRPNA
jgi:hypothetical protein